MRTARRWPMTMLVNIFRDPYDVYIGRPGFGATGRFGNLHPVGRPCRLCRGAVHTRTESLAAFTRDFRLRVATDPQFREEVQALRGKRLGCYCTGPCHGEVIVAWLEDGQASAARVPVRE